jgi:hypothetical protein
MKDFDSERLERIAEREQRFEREERDRSFLLGGEVFQYRLVVPFSAVEAIYSVSSDSGLGSIVDRVNTALHELVEPEEDDAAFARLERVKHVVELIDLQDVVFWVLSEISRRPTSAPSSSGDGRETTGENSTEPSSSEAEAQVASVA